MARYRGSILVDTNVILECRRAGCWRALSAEYRLETVEKCVEETQTGFQRRRPEQLIDETELRASLATVHTVETLELAEVSLGAPDIYLDAGEKSLWAHALTRPRDDAWLLCGPDKASLRFGVRFGFGDRLAALEKLLDDIGHRPRQPLREPYTRKWLRTTLGQLIMSEKL